MSASLEYICSIPLTIQLHPSESQTAFNLKRWRQLLADPELARLPFRVETDRHGHILMGPPPAPAHGKKQTRIGILLEQFLPNGQVVTECSVSTSDLHDDQDKAIFDTAIIVTDRIVLDRQLQNIWEAYPLA